MQKQALTAYGVWCRSMGVQTAVGKISTERQRYVKVLNGIIEIVRVNLPIN